MRAIDTAAATLIVLSLVGCASEQPRAAEPPLTSTPAAPLEGTCPQPFFDPHTGQLVVRGSMRYRRVFLMARKERPGEPHAPPARIVLGHERGDELVFDLLGPAIDPRSRALTRATPDLHVHRFFNLYDGAHDWASVWVDHPALQNLRVTTAEDPSSGGACYELLLPED